MKKYKLLAILFAGTMVFSSIALAGCGSSGESSGGSSSENEVYAVSDEMANPPITNREIDKDNYNYEDIITQFEIAGFTKVSTRVYNSKSYEEGVTKEISINGITDFKKKEEFPIDSKVVITYYTKKESEVETEAAPKELNKEPDKQSSIDTIGSGSAKSGDFTINYNIESDNSATITGIDGTGNELTIFSSYDGHDVKAIGDSAIKNCTTIKTIDIPSETKRIGKHALDGCTNLEKVYMWGKPDIDDYAFAGCISLETIDISSDTKIIGNHAFDGCTKLKTVYMWGHPDIGDYAFANCTSLDSIDIPSDTKIIGNHAFDECTKLRNVFMWGHPDIGDYAFTKCSSIKSIDIPSDTKKIGDHAFDGCTNLENVYMWSNDVVIGTDAFANCPKLKDIPK